MLSSDGNIRVLIHDSRQSTPRVDPTTSAVSSADSHRDAQHQHLPLSRGEQVQQRADPLGELRESWNLQRSPVGSRGRAHLATESAAQVGRRREPDTGRDRLHRQVCLLQQGACLSNPAG